VVSFAELNPFLALYTIAQRLGLFALPGFESLFSKSYFLYKRYWEDPYAPLLREHPALFTGGDILDVGANIGYTATLFATVVSPGYRVIAFEPEAKNFGRLTKMIKARGLSQKIIGVQAAVSDRAGRSELWLNPEHHGDHHLVTAQFQGNMPGGHTQKVSVLTLDDYYSSELKGRNIRFIKIDVQGFEESVCLGMSKILACYPQAVVGLEYYPKGMEDLGFNSSSVLSFFKERGYRVWTLTRARGARASHYDEIPKTLGSGGYTDLLFSKSDTILDDKSR
jgi:FkbM family methyltransferase